MAKKIWQTIKVQNCQHANDGRGGEVALEAEVLYPEEHLPDQGPRVVAHRCSQGVECSLLLSESACVWAGSNPAYDPFTESQEKK